MSHQECEEQFSLAKGIPVCPIAHSLWVMSPAGFCAWLPLDHLVQGVSCFVAFAALLSTTDIKMLM